jgi:hypothetical protein
MFFSEEKNQKTFVLSADPTIEAMAGILPRAPEIKVFTLLVAPRLAGAFADQGENGA